MESIHTPYLLCISAYFEAGSSSGSSRVIKNIFMEIDKLSSFFICSIPLSVPVQRHNLSGSNSIDTFYIKYFETNFHVDTLRLH